MRTAYVYIMTNDRRTLYIGVTTNLEGRIYEHQRECYPGFTQRYHLHQWSTSKSMVTFAKL